MVWFLAPTVPLCEQQYGTIKKKMRATKTRLLLGSDGVDRWSHTKTWNEALKGIRIVVSTPQILKDALGHAFVSISGLSLLIFDEAHHATKKHAYNKIMQDFYHPEKFKNGSKAVPRVLGLTASPVMSSKIAELG